MIAILLGCGLRRAELSALRREDIQIRQGHWAIVDLVGKGNHVRTVPMPGWVKNAIDRWLTAACVTMGRVFRAVSRHGTVWGNGISENVVWYVVRNCALRLELDHLAPHDLRRTCANVFDLWWSVQLLARMECATLSSYLALQSWETAWRIRLGERRVRPLCHLNCSPADLAGNMLERRRWAVDVGIAKAISKPVSDRHHLQATQVRF